MSERLILMGVIGKPHGVRGLVRVQTYTEDADALSHYPLTDRNGRQFSLEWQHENVAQLSEITPSGKRKITDRNEVEKLNLTELFAPRSAFPEPDEEEFYLADLIGLAARDEAGKTLGTIAAVHDYGGGSSLEIFCPGTAPLLVPFTKAATPKVDIQSGYVLVVPPSEIIASEAGP